MKTIFYKILTIISGLIIGLLIGELILRRYNPLPSRIKGNQINLLTNFQRNVDIKNEFQQAGLDKSIRYSTNSIGFRGEEPPFHFEKHYSIITVGGSTTECSLLDDTKTWSYKLNDLLSNKIDSIWVNNAGIDGCSTFGHQVLLDEHIFKLKPNMIIFLVGVNEIHVASSQSGDNFLQNTKEYRFRKFAQKSELFSFLWNFYRQSVSKKRNIGHSNNKNPSDLSKKEIEIKNRFYLNDQKKYRQRLNNIVEECLNQNIKPVLVTQPIYNLTDYHPYSFVRLYNQTTITIAQENDIEVIDLASKLDDNPDYYYDSMHYTNNGAERIAEIIYTELLKVNTFIY